MSNSGSNPVYTVAEAGRVIKPRQIKILLDKACNHRKPIFLLSSSRNSALICTEGKLILLKQSCKVR